MNKLRFYNLSHMLDLEIIGYDQNDKLSIDLMLQYN